MNFAKMVRTPSLYLAGSLRVGVWTIIAPQRSALSILSSILHQASFKSFKSFMTLLIIASKHFVMRLSFCPCRQPSAQVSTEHKLYTRGTPGFPPCIIPRASLSLSQPPDTHYALCQIWLVISLYLISGLRMIRTTGRRWQLWKQVRTRHYESLDPV